MAEVDLRNEFLPIHSQRGLQSCLALVVCDLLWWELKRNPERWPDHVDFVPSAHFVYYNARRRTRNENLNIPVAPSEAMAALTEVGVCRDELWPYRPGCYCQRPIPEAFTAAREFTGWTFQEVPQTLDALRDSLLQRIPFFFCLRFYPSNNWDFEAGAASKTGLVSLPKPEEFPMRNHAMLAIGFDDQTETFLARNTYGPEWGEAGHARIPFEYLSDTQRSYAFWRIVPPGLGSELLNPVD